MFCGVQVFSYQINNLTPNFDALKFKMNIPSLPVMVLLSIC